MVTITEVRAGLKKNARKTVSNLKEVFRPIPLNDEMAELAGEFKQKYNLGIADMFIAATAVASGSTLATYNKKHFPMPHLRILEAWCIVFFEMARKKSEPVDSPQKVNVASQKLQAIRVAMEQIEKQYGKGSIMRLGERTASQGQVDAIPSGSIALDLALGIGGFPRGRVIEIYGPEASGKTTVALHVIAEVQKRGGTAAFVDAEHALDPARAEAIGVNVDDLLISQPDTGEQALEIVETLVRSGGIDVVVVDSVAALVPRAEIEGEMGDAIIGVQARLMSQALRKLSGAISKTKTSVIFTNQLRHKIGVMFGNPETTPGGLALKFYASVRIDLRKIETLKDGDSAIGSRHRARIVKNKVAPPFRVAEFDILNDGGISRYGGLIDVGVELGVLERSGAFYRSNGTMLGQGKPAAVAFLQDKKNKKLVEELDRKIRAKAASTKNLPKELGEDREEE